MFYRERCDLCGDCLRKCLYIDFDEGSEPLEIQSLINGEVSGEDNDSWLRQCITCFACNEYCPYDARPFDLILERLEQMGDYVNPDLPRMAEQMFTPRAPFSPKETGPVALSLCTIYTAVPWAFSGSLFDGLTPLKGTHFFCGLIYPHMGNDTLMRGKLPPLLDKFASLKVEKVVFAHDDCYSVMTDAAARYGLALPFEPVHLFEYLRDMMKKRATEIRPLHLKVAYQRPCASRLTPWKESCLDEIFDRIGVTRVARHYDRENAMCCGQDMGGIHLRGNKFPAFKDKNIADAVAHGADAMVYLCPMCLDALYQPSAKQGLDNYMVSDLCRLAIGETLPDNAYAQYKIQPE